ncbi:MAG: hypothetical protein Ct9H90mP22_2520 [Gammaproteobacteria bacterium]|nr:MAG: hypothetical protein Ct9H90mP22_2520 [Gammaproteobacteria bacterium]
MIFSNEGLYPLIKASFYPDQLAFLSLKSAPAEKPLPAPVRITTLTESSFITFSVAFCKFPLPIAH